MLDFPTLFLILCLRIISINLLKINNMPIIWTALRWFGTVAIGWLGSDIYNEAKTTEQVTAGTVVNGAKNSLMSRGWLYAIAFLVILVVFFILKKLKIVKK